MATNTVAIYEKFPLLEQCLQEVSADELEWYSKTAKSVLAELQSPLDNAKDDPDASRFLEAISRLKTRAESTRTVVGVVGNTGSGKSSVINAVLDEEMLVPTNCMRACTAVITELSYNYLDDPMALYRAEVEFISHQEWETELAQLFEDLVDAKGDINQDSANMGTEAGVAWAKIKAVYPQLTKEGLSRTTAVALANVPEVLSVLGQEHLIVEETPDVFREKMQRFIDSDEKDSRQGNKGGRKQLQFWPLIKVVRVFTKAQALSTGLVIVDLPGAQDSNAARAAIAGDYMKQCDNLWIVAPITRAVDDKTAQNLMGQSSKLQLKLDCKYSKITFICSKTDDISISEAVQSLRLEEIEICHTAFQNAQSVCNTNQESFKAAKEEWEHKANVLRGLESQINELRETVDELEDSVTTGGDISYSRKRKGSSRQLASHKRAYGVPGEFSSSDSEDSSQEKRVHGGVQDSNVDNEELDEEPLTAQQIRAELRRLQAEKAFVEDQVQQLHSVARRASKLLKKSTSQRDALDMQLKSLCIQGRNKFSTKCIQQDYATGMKELDQEAAMFANNELPYDETTTKDYQKVAASLPVFCVSSRAFQKKRERLDMDKDIQGFPTLDDTGIPPLQAYAKQLAEPYRKDAALKLLEGLKKILNSLNLWSRDHGGGNRPHDVERRDHVNRLQGSLLSLRNSLQRAVDEVIKQCREIMTKKLYAKFDEAVQKATGSATKAVEQWFARRKDGGLTYASYKAMCARNGAYSSKSFGHRDLNEELAAPLKQALAHSWERAFADEIPRVLDGFLTDFKRQLEDFSKNMRGRFQGDTPPTKIQMEQLMMLGMLTGGHSYSMSSILTCVKGKMTTLQRKASRELTPAVAGSMKPAYIACKRETGKGSYSRMKAVMIDHFATNGNDMFQNAIASGRTQLVIICNQLEDDLRGKIDEVITEMTSEYGLIVADKDFSKTSRLARTQVSEALSRVDCLFRQDQRPGRSGMRVKVEEGETH